MTTVKQLKADAKVIGIKGYSKMTKAQLIEAIALASVASEPKASEPSNVIAPSIEMIRNPIVHSSEQALIAQDDADDFFEDGDLQDETLAVYAVKRIEFIKGTNLAVQFKYNGKLVIIGWSRSDYKMHSWSEINNKAMLTSYASQMKFFKLLKNGLDGDVAQTVKALVRIKAMPSEIKVLQRKATRSDDQNVSDHRVDENVRIRRGVVDPNVMNVFVGMYAEAMQTSESDVRKNGMLIREFMNEYASVESEIAIEDFAASYISDIYNALYELV